MSQLMRITDLTGTGVLLAIPDQECARDQIIVSVGDSRRCPVAVINHRGHEEVVPRSLSVVSVSAPRTYTQGDLETFLMSIKRLSE